MCVSEENVSFVVNSYLDPFFTPTQSGESIEYADCLSAEG